MGLVLLSVQGFFMSMVLTREYFRGEIERFRWLDLAINAMLLEPQIAFLIGQFEAADYIKDQVTSLAVSQILLLHFTWPLQMQIKLWLSIQFSFRKTGRRTLETVRAND
jgi:hypothetical protein